MPKVLDEDQLRRKKALDEKRAARRLAKQQEERSAVETTEQQQHGSADVDLHGLNDETTAGTKKGEKKHDKTSRLLELPEDAIRLIYVMLEAADLGRLAMTCRTLTTMLSDARTYVVRARCCRMDTVPSGRVRYMELCGSETDAKDLLTASYGGGDTGRVVPRNRFAKKQPPPPVEFCSYARFLQESATGVSYLSTGARIPIVLPRFVQGRFASVSPEHSLCRVGGDGEKCGGGGSGLASWGVGRRGQVRVFVIFCLLGSARLFFKN